MTFWRRILDKSLRNLKTICNVFKPLFSIQKMQCKSLVAILDTFSFWRATRLIRSGWIIPEARRDDSIQGWKKTQLLWAFNWSEKCVAARLATSISRKDDCFSLVINNGPKWSVSAEVDFHFWAAGLVIIEGCRIFQTFEWYCTICQLWLKICRTKRRRMP